ncbi:MAG: DNA polymerase IV [Oscillospiraceae bacterium]|nr:DNA polymerase IV [Oscillospiraceae bacterium]
MDRVILHSDINSCYASVEKLYDPTLEGKPFAVCGDKELRHGIVLSKDDIAKRAGVKTGEAIWEAKQKCPELRIVEPHFDRYMKYSRMLRDIYSEYTDLCEPFGIDESWLDITNCLACPDGKRTAVEIKERVKRETGLTVSVGVSWNKVLAKLGSDYKKPDAVTVIDRGHFRDMVWPLPASDMLMVGHSTSKALRRMGINTIGELAQTKPELLRARFGKNGELLYAYANGLDSAPVRRIGEAPPPKSIGNSTTMPADVNSVGEARPVLLLLAESVGARLRNGGYLCRTVEISLRSTELEWSSHRIRLRYATDITAELYEYAVRLLAASHEFPGPLRSMGLRALELVPADSPEQVDIFIDYVNKEKQEKIDAAVDKIRKKYGNALIQRASILGAIPSDFGFCALP